MRTISLRLLKEFHLIIIMMNPSQTVSATDVITSVEYYVTDNSSINDLSTLIDLVGTSR